MKASQRIRILVVDDHAVMRRGLRHLLATYPDMEVIGEAEDALGALRAAVNLNPHVILLDIRMPGVSGIEIAPRLRQAAPNSRIIILTTYDNDEYLTKSMGAGAHGYLLKSTSDENLAEAIRAVHRGERLVSPDLLTKMLAQVETLSRTQARVESGMDESDLQILRLLASGATNKHIADHLFLSERTVKRRVQEILKKLRVSTRAQAVIEATQRGLI